jgi:hypothetical protein
MRRATLLLSTLLFALAAPAARSQVLDGQWFKLTVSFQGTGGGENGAEEGQIKKLVRYAQFSSGLPDGGAPSYQLVIYSPTTDDGWLPTDEGSVDMLDEAETYARSATIDLHTTPVVPVDGAPNIATVQFNGPVKIKLKNEELKSAKITAFASLAYFTNDSFALYGKARLSLNRVALEDLPFEPAALLAPQPAPPAAEAQAEKP